MTTYFYDCYDENFKPITQIFCKDTIELFEKVPNVKYLLCMEQLKMQKKTLVCTSLQI